MIFNMNGSKGASLNFEVVGGTSAPTNPKPNTIWVKTDTTITGWVFSSTEPSSVEAGMVWFHTGTSSPIGFNAVEKNCVGVYPDYAQQYLNGRFLKRDVYSFVDGEWVQFSVAWDGYYFKDGNQYTEYTGGWTGWGSYNSEYSVGNTLYMWSTAGSGSDIPADSRDVGLRTVNKVDLTNVKTLYATCESTGGSYSVYFMVGTELTNWVYADIKTSMETSGTKSIDVSGLTGEYYIYFGGSGVYVGSINLNISAVWGV